MRVYIHEEGTQELKVAELGDETTVESLAGTHSGTEDPAVWLEAAEEPLSSELTLVEAGVGDRAHVYVGKRDRKLVSVSVRFNADRKTETVKPATTVERVFRWAVGMQGFNLDRVERPKHTLLLCADQTEPGRETHIGSLAGPDGEVCFDLVPRHRFEGLS
jgi:hypothetical protein